LLRVINIVNTSSKVAPLNFDSPSTTPTPKSDALSSSSTHSSSNNAINTIHESDDEITAQIKKQVSESDLNTDEQVELLKLLLEFKHVFTPTDGPLSS